MTLSETIIKVKDALEKAGIAGPALDAEVLISFSLKMERYRLIVENRRKITASEAVRINKLIERRIKGEPVAYITGKKEFYALDFQVTPDVLIPRPETELLVDLAVYYAKQGGAVLDLGTGSGAIAVSIKHSRPDLDVYGSDISDRALQIAKKNCRALLKKNSIKFIRGDMFTPVSGLKFDVIVSNPPYIDPSLKGCLAREIDFEPEIALYAGDSGKKIIGRIITDGGAYLGDGGIIIMEMAPDQTGFIRELSEKYCYTVSILNDYSGIPGAAVLKKRN